MANQRLKIPDNEEYYGGYGGWRLERYHNELKQVREVERWWATSQADKKGHWEGHASSSKKFWRK